tara:strand:- start:146 stop:526 length:381 start_codon:yes stop_codon:yes gene_type:complete
MKKLSKLLLALSFVLSVTTSSYAVTVASWGGAYTESQKLGYGDPTAKKLGIEINWVDYSGGLSEIKAQKEAGAITWDIIDLFAFDTINDVTKVYLLNLILTKTSQLLQMEHLQVKISSQVCLVNVQ